MSIKLIWNDVRILRARYREARAAVHRTHVVAPRRQLLAMIDAYRARHCANLDGAHDCLSLRVQRVTERWGAVVGLTTFAWLQLQLWWANAYWGEL